jgi:hypothetical protein
MVGKGAGLARKRLRIDILKAMMGEILGQMIGTNRKRKSPVNC